MFAATEMPKPSQGLLDPSSFCSLAVSMDMLGSCTHVLFLTFLSVNGIGIPIQVSDLHFPFSKYEHLPFCTCSVLSLVGE